MSCKYRNRYSIYNKVLNGAQIANFLASDWFSCLLTGNTTADHLVAKGLRAQLEVT